MVGNRIKHLREQRAVSQTELAGKIGVSKQTLYKYENNIITNIPSDKIELLAKFLETTPSYIMGWEEIPVTFDITASFDGSARVIDGNSKMPTNLIPLPKTRSIPLIGEIACGDPILAEQNIADHVPVPEHIHGADFALTCKGDSMINARIFDGDIVYIHQQPEVENGQIAAVLIGSEATLKRVYKHADKLVLNPENPAYEPLVLSGAELEDVKIIGKAVAFISAVR